MSKFIFGLLYALSGVSAWALPLQNQESASETPVIQFAPSPTPSGDVPSNNSVAVPCSTVVINNIRAQESSPLVSCGCYLYGNDCPEHLKNSKGLFVDLERRFQKYVDPSLVPSEAKSIQAARGLYQGVDQNPMLADGGNIPFCNGGTICSLLPTPFSTKDGAPFAELDTNHLGASCGKYRNIEVKVRKGKAAIVRFISDIKGGVGTRERAYVCGGYVASIGHHYQKVRSEIENTMQLSLPPSGSTPHACQVFAKNLQGANVKFDQATQAFKNEFVKQRNISDIWNCDKKENELTDAAGNRRVSMTHLCGARASLQNAFSQLAVCVIAANAQKDYQAQLGDPGVASRNLRRVSEQVNARCDGEIRRAKPKDQAALNARAQACYEREYASAFKELFESQWSPYAK